MNIIITGASKGLGKAIATLFAQKGYTLFLCARNEKALLHTAQTLQLQNPQSKIYTKAIDISISANAKEFANWCLSYGTPNILINNAAQFIAASLLHEEEKTLENLMHTNVYSAINITKILLPAMMQHKQGHIFNICSTAAIQAYTKASSYSITKHALLGFSRNLCHELKPNCIKVTAIIPGAIHTESWMNEKVDKTCMLSVDEVAEKIYTTSLLSFQNNEEEIILQP